MESWGHLHCSYQSSFSHFSSLYEFNCWTYLCNSNFTYVRSWKHRIAKELLLHSGVENCLLLGLQYTSIRTGLAEHTLSSIMAALTARIKKITYCIYGITLLLDIQTELKNRKWEQMWPLAPPYMYHAYVPCPGWWQLELTAGSKHQVEASDNVSLIHIMYINMHWVL